MQNAKQMLQAIRKLGEKQLPLTRVYRALYSEELFLAAYNNLYRNAGALTPGTENDTMDGMSIKRLNQLIHALRHEQFHPRPSRRTHVPKKRGGTRPLGIPNGSEKLVQEVIRMVLEAYYEPRFRDSSHGFRPQRGCHTALRRIKQTFDGSTWFIEGDIKGCFDTIDHTVLMNILRRDIHDNRLLLLIQRFLKAGYMEDWTYHETYSGTPQGGVLSPLLSNIYLHELDSFVEDTLIPQYTKGGRRKVNKAYKRFEFRIRQAQERGDIEQMRALKKERRSYPVGDMHDPDFRRLRYVRYADDFILSFIGTKVEAEVIKAQVGQFLQERLHLTMQQDKTLITHARADHARFLNYAVSIYHADNKLSRRQDNALLARSINGKVRLGVPYGLIDERSQRYMRNGKVVSEPQMLQDTDAHIVHTYQLRFRGITQYYKYAVDRIRFGKLKYVMEIALVKTLAHKFRISVRSIYRKYRTTAEVEGRTYRVLQVEVPTEKGARLFHWGGIPLRVSSIDHDPVNDKRADFDSFQFLEKRSDIVTRLRANTCEVCGKQDNCQVHHVRKLADLKQRWHGRRAKPLWVQKMIALSRKTLVVCESCHRLIHTGNPLPREQRI
jgi:group II intron reverse transcriptase/maturase